jgi:hypothetical protein
MSTEQVTKVWENSMSQFVTAEFQTFLISEGQSFLMMERINYNMSTKIRGVFYVQEPDESTKLSCVVMDENMDVLFSNHNNHKALIEFDTSIVGDSEYSFLFKNESPGERVVVFGLHTDETVKSYSLPEWDIDKNGVLVERFNQDKEDENLLGEGELSAEDMSSA